MSSKPLLCYFLPEPIPASQLFPHRMLICGWLAPIVERLTARAVALLALDWSVFAVLMVATTLLAAWWA